MPSPRQYQTFEIQVQWQFDAEAEVFRVRATHALDAFRQFRQRLTYDEGTAIERLTVAPAKAEPKPQSQPQPTRCPECGATKCCYECASRGGPGTDLMTQEGQSQEQNP
jgi:hypothetical protein